MSRYIDADALIRYGKRGTLVYWEDIEDAPSIDIVRCKECKHHFYDESNDCKMCYIHEYGEIWEDDDYCSYGKRRNDD